MLTIYNKFLNYVDNNQKLINYLVIITYISSLFIIDSYNSSTVTKNILTIQTYLMYAFTSVSLLLAIFYIFINSSLKKIENQFNEAKEHEKKNKYLLS